MIRFRTLETPTGPFVIARREDGLLTTRWIDDAPWPAAASRRDDDLEPELSDRIVRYFEGEPVDFLDVPLPRGATFFTRCWSACRHLPRGRTCSYGDLARRAGSPAAARAAGQAMRRNPLPIIVPCHRVVGTGNALGGFCGTSASGSDPLQRKAWLLEMEARSMGATLRTS